VSGERGQEASKENEQAQTQEVAEAHPSPAPQEMMIGNKPSCH
jgi:hypothetical protein